MKANELMIGDWVVYNGDVDYINPIKIEGMDIATGMCVTTDRDDVGFDGVWPIPLTPEILEKNGFVRFNSSDWEVQIEHTYIELRPTEGNIAVWMDWENIDVYADFILPYPKFVHELQHALRFCKVNKEIIIKQDFF